jgi:glyoxylase-like metal-dependent hydrolase (beta-lactamase superfamily II)
MTERWQVGDITITSVVEDETLHIPPELFFPDATAADVLRHDWLQPDYADADGNIGLRVQATVIRQPGRTVLVDPCVGNLKPRPVFFWDQQEWPFLERLADAGVGVTDVDAVVHTHLHADHVGWGTQLVDGAWVPTFTRAPHLYTERELAWCELGDNPGTENVYADSVAPVIAAGLSEIVAEDADLGDGLRLEPSTGHTPGHVSLWIESQGETAIVTGDFLHHPVQCSEPHLAEVGDFDVEQARATRRRMLSRIAETGALMFGTHFSGQPAGRLVAAGDAWRFEPVAQPFGGGR